MISLTDQLTALGALDYAQPLTHCSGTYTDELPSKGFQPGKPTAKDAWTSGMSQIFGSVSADAHYEFDIQYANRFYKDFGLVYYGCCEPLDIKMHVVEKVENLRKISMSPWTDSKRGASLIGDKYVYSSKPAPSVFAGRFSVDLVEAEIRRILNDCKEHNCPVEFILKDVSTIKYRPDYLEQWEEAVMKIVQS
jgi:hypothetical protein